MCRFGVGHRHMAQVNWHPAPMKKLLGFVVVILLAGCEKGGIQPVDPPTESAESAESVAPTLPPTTPPSPSTSTTIPAAATVPNTTVPPTTTAPTPSTVPIEEEIRLALDQFRAAYHACTAEPANCDPSTFATESGATAMREVLADFVAHDVVAGPGLEPSIYRIDQLNVSGDTAAVESCVWDTGILYGRPPGPGLERTILNDLESTRHEHIELRRVDGRWLVDGRSFVGDDLVGVNQCVA